MTSAYGTPDEPYALRITHYASAYRARIRRERRLRFLALAALVVGVAWAGAALLYYLGITHPLLIPLCVALTVLLPFSAVVVEMVTSPSIEQTAALVDSKLDNRQRLVTAVELMAQDDHAPLAQAQLGSTASLLAGTDPRVVYPARAPLPLLAASAGLLLLALGLFLLSGIRDGLGPFQSGSPQAGQQVPTGPTPTPLSGLPGGAEPPQQPQEGQQPQEVTGQEGAQPQDGQQSGQSTAPATSPEEAARQAEESRQAEAGLQRLARALNEQSVTQEAADNLRQGNYDEAAEQLAELGQETDQLSEEAKQGLADALRRAADDTASNPDLQQAEREAADALENGNVEQRANALEELGEAIRRTSGEVVPQEELTKSFPEPSEDDSQGSDQQSESSQGEQGDDGGEQTQGGEQGGDSGSQQGETGGQGGESGQPGGQGSGENDGEGTGTGAGEGSRVTGPADTRTIDEQGNPFELEGRGDPGNSRPGEGNEPPGVTMDEGAGTSEATAPSPGGPVNARGESNNAPVERWDIIQRYFSHEDE